MADSPAGATRDLVTDFAPGQDLIDLAGVDADSTVPGNQSFRWVGKANLTGAAQLGYFVSGGTTIVRASTDADAAAELEIQLTGTKTLTRGRFPALSWQPDSAPWLIWIKAPPVPRAHDGSGHSQAGESHDDPSVDVESAGRNGGRRRATGWACWRWAR